MHFITTAQSFIPVNWNEDGIYPHTETERASYTIPDGKYAVIQCGHLYLVRTQAPTTLGTAYIKIGVLLQGDTLVRIMMPMLRNSAVGAITLAGLVVPVYLRPGDVIKVWSADDSVGGYINYGCSLLVTTFV